MKEFKSYSRIRKKAEKAGLPTVQVPNLLQMQISSYHHFLQKDAHPQKRENIGLQAILTSIYPLEDSKGIYHLDYIDYVVLKEKYNTDECIERNLSYQAPIKARMRLVIYDEELLKETGERRVKNTIEQDVFLGEIPLITEDGTFVINGAERVIISQLHKSPGVFFTETKHASGKILYSSKVIPYNGSWLEFKMDINDAMFILIDKRRKLPVTVMLRAVGLSTNEDLRNHFYEEEKIPVKAAKGRFFFKDVFDEETGEIVCDAASEIDDEILEQLKESGLKKVSVITQKHEITRKIIENTIAKDLTTNQEEAVKKIYNLIRPGEEPTYEVALELFNRMFFNERRYNLGEVGRYKINFRLNLDIDPSTHILTKQDLVAIVEL